MKEKRSLLIGIILGALIGGTLVFFCLPVIVKDFSFLLGFIACLVLVSLGLILLFVWNKHVRQIKFLGKSFTTKDSRNARGTNVLIWILFSVITVLGGLVSSFLILNQDELFKTQTQYQKKRIEHQSELIESIRNSSLVFLMNNILDKVDDELKNNPKRTLSDETIARIVALSYSFKPYVYLEGDSLSEKKLSPERGQLLLVLSKMNIDSSSFYKIKLGAPFYGADLKDANLKDADLSGANLKGADLKDANLKGADLKGADLREANLWGANLNMAILSGANLKRADLRWAELNGADLKLANLNGADLTSAKLRRVDLSGAKVEWADLSGAFLIEANLAGVDLFGTSLKRANLRKANLSDANLRTTNWSDANLSDANLSGANLRSANLSDAILSGVELTKVEVMEENWLEKLNEWRVTGAKEIQKRYKIVDDKSDQSNYRLEKIED